HARDGAGDRRARHGDAGARAHVQLLERRNAWCAGAGRHRAAEGEQDRPARSRVDRGVDHGRDGVLARGCNRVGGRDVELIVKLTRAQLVALEPCDGGLEAFDQIAPSGTLEARSESELASLSRSVKAEWRKWAGNVVPAGYGYGDGNGYGNGYGYGNGASSTASGGA